MRITLLLTLACLCCGCAKYEFDLLEPRDLARHIAPKTDTIVPVDPLEYRLRAVDNRLVMRIYNNTSDEIQLSGERSTVVDPRGQSHPIRGQTILPNTFAKLILSPPRPRVEPYGPTWGFGVGVGVSRHDHHHPVFNDPYDYQPRYFDIYDDASNLYWEWDGESTVHMTLTFRRCEQEFRHPFTFHRVKM